MKYFKIGMLFFTIIVAVTSSALDNIKSVKGINDYYYVTVATTLVTTTTQLDNIIGPLDPHCVDITECDIVSANACIVKQLTFGYRTIFPNGPKS